MTRLSARRAREIIDGARLVKAPDHADTCDWHVITEDGTLLVVIRPSYGGTSATGRNGWTWALPGHAPSRPEPTRKDAAAAGLAAWQRAATRKDTR